MQFTRFIYLKISSEIKHNAIQFFKLVKYEKFNKLVELQTDLVIKSFQFEYDEFDEDVINHFRSFFSVFEVYYLQEDSMHTLIDTVLETLYDSVVSELTKIYLKLKESGKIAELLSANTKQRLFQIINGVGEAIPLIALSSTKTRFTYNNTHDSFGRFVHNILLGIDMSITISKELVNQNVSSLHHFDFLEIMTYGTSLYTEYANLTIIREFNPKIQASISDLFKDDIKMLINHFKSYIDSHGWVDENEYLRKNLEKLIKDAINSKTFFNWGIDSYFDIFEYFLLYKMVQKDGIFSIISLITLSLHVENHEIVFNKMDEIFEKAELKSIINQIKMIPHDTKLVDVWISSKDNIEYLELDKYNWIISKLDDTFKK